MMLTYIGLVGTHRYYTTDTGRLVVKPGHNGCEPRDARQEVRSLRRAASRNTQLARQHPERTLYLTRAWQQACLAAKIEELVRK